jgi:hypothetical protein
VKIKLIIFLFTTICISAQKVDSVYIQPYKKKMSATGFVSTNTLQLTQGSQTFIPNYPINAGIGLAVKNTVINFAFAQSLSPLKSSKYGKSTITDLQIHRYDRKFLIDFYYQRYKGFYTEQDNLITLYPELTVKQIGADFIYLFNGNKFSAKAAFEQSEKQLQSSGSFLMGAGFDWQKLTPDEKQLTNSEATQNLQLGINSGYAYNWVINKQWMMSGIATAGINFGNETNRLKDGKLRIYPTANARASATYLQNNWSASFSMLINNRQIYTQKNNPYDLMSLTFQLSFTQQLDRFFRKNK